MTTTPAAAPTKALTPVQQRRLTLRNLFDQQKPELSKLLPRGMDPERLFRMALTECVKNPDLLACSAESWALAMQTCAAQGLYPDSGLGYMYLIPREISKKRADGQWEKVAEVTAMRGYQGDIALARRSGEIADLYAEVVYERDTYKVTKGLHRNIEHVPYDGDDDPGPLKAAYAVAKLVSGEVTFVALTKRDVMRHKASAQGTDNAKSPWKNHEAAMWRKSAIRELAKWLPKATEIGERLVRALAADADPRVIDMTPRAELDLGRAELPSAPRPALDQITEQLGGGADPEPEPETVNGCAHPAVPPARLAGGKTLVCPDCGEELTDPAIRDAQEAREPGSDDGDPDPREAVQAIAGAAAAQAPRPAAPRKPRLQE